MQPALAAATSAGGNRDGQGLLKENAVWLSPAAAQMLELQVGDELVAQVALDRVTFRVAGLLPPGAFRQPVGMLDIATAQWRLQRLGRIDRVDLRLSRDANPATVRKAIAAMLPPGVQIVTPGEATDDAVRLTRAYRLNLTALALVALFTGAFLVYATQSLAVARRRREIALLHAMGLTVREQLFAALLSGAIVGVLGAALGVVLGALVARAGLAAFGADLGAGYFRNVAPQLDIRAIEYGAFFFLGVAAAVIATLAPAREAASVPAAAALKAGDEAPVAARLHGRIALVLIAAGIAALALPSIKGIALSGYVSIACLLLGGVFLVPSLAAAVFSRLRPEGPAWRQVAVAQLRGTARSATVSIAAILVSFSLMVAMAIMVFSFRMSLESWMERILPADLYVRAGSASQAAYLDPAAQAVISSMPGVERVHFVRFQDIVLPGERLPLTVIARPIAESTRQERVPIRRSDRNPRRQHRSCLGIRGRARPARLRRRHAVRPAVRRQGRACERARRVARLRAPGGAVVIDRDRYIELTATVRERPRDLAARRQRPGSLRGTVRAALQRTGDYEIALPAEIRKRSLAAVRSHLRRDVPAGSGRGADRPVRHQREHELAGAGAPRRIRHAAASRRHARRDRAHARFRRRGARRASAWRPASCSARIISMILIFVVNRQSFHWTMDLHVPWLLLAALSATLLVASAATAAFSGRRAMGDDVVRAVKEDW